MTTTLHTSSSPEIQPMRISTTPVFSQRHSITSIESDDRNPSPRICSTFDNHDDQYRVVSPNKRASVVSKRDSVYTYDEESDDLDDQMRILVKQKERVSGPFTCSTLFGSSVVNQSPLLSFSPITAKYPSLEAGHSLESVKRTWRSS
jgi:hypothetical protein